MMIAVEYKGACLAGPGATAATSFGGVEENWEGAWVFVRVSARCLKNAGGRIELRRGGRLVVEDANMFKALAHGAAALTAGGRLTVGG